MNVKELIEELSKFDGREMVVVRGYEDYYDDVDTVSTLTLAYDAFKPTGWGGRHMDAKSDEGRKSIIKVSTRPIVPGVYLHYSKAQNKTHE